jgi:hypothetical protein
VNVSWRSNWLKSGFFKGFARYFVTEYLVSAANNLGSAIKNPVPDTEYLESGGNNLDGVGEHSESGRDNLE